MGRVASNQSIQELKTMLSKREVDNARLRDQREQLNAEVLERKQKESVKYASMQECKTLAESRSERIIVLESELKRLKSRLAAEARDEDLMKFIFAHEANATSSDYINTFKNRASTAEKKVVALEQSLVSLEHDHPDVSKCKKTEAETRQRLAEAMAELEKYQSIFGGSPLPPDLSRVTEQLKLKDEELQQLRLVKEQQSQAEASLYVELEKLSTSWEALDRQVKSKIFDLSQLEERLSKSGLEKAKSENKFFAAMRDKEAVDVERKNLSRNLEKQAKLLERLHESERSLRDQVTDLEKEIMSFRKACALLKRENQKLLMDVDEAKIQAEHVQKEKEAMRASTSQREVQIQAAFARLRATEDDLVRARKGVEQQAQEWKKTPAGTSQNKMDGGEVQSLKELLRCSICKTNFRNTIITKCMHTFCKHCVEARITTRQRKCPACNILFSQSDVQTLWFQ
ncbi:hypothetical protein M378DRAFT_449286 [Amanita muscaria Koide BX008]|uniref:E3 ubiquitin protein ligase n=1 Tax=Amanita muscaria (strain Koide BX008) TaxID=946122 RepID=A0A0C2WVY6_AMAMK|nr:hypothetical protein M378DRAFT_449286 [Amanita muscaria Koide BX008]